MNMENGSPNTIIAPNPKVNPEITPKIPPPILIALTQSFLGTKSTPKVTKPQQREAVKDNL